MTYGMSSPMTSRGPTGLNPNQTGTGSMREKIPSGYRKSSLNNYTPQQQQLHEQQFGFLGPDSYLNRLATGDQSFFEEMEAPAFRQLNELQGGLASRFSGMGLGARRSSGFQNAANQQVSNFAQDLQSRRQEYMRQAINDLMGFSNQILNQRPQENFLVKKNRDSSGWGGLAGAGLGATGGFLAGGPAGLLSGAKLGYDVGSQF